MRNELYGKIASGFVKAPAVQNKVWDEAYIVIDRVDDSGFGEVAMVVTVDKGKGEMPEHPKNTEDDRGSEKVKTPPDTMGSISTPA